MTHPRVDSHGRSHTDASLRKERDDADDRDSVARDTADGEADEAVRVARKREDEAAPTDGATDAAVQAERGRADAKVEHARADRRGARAASLQVDRAATDDSLTGERAGADTTIDDMREANEQMVAATFEARDLAVEAEIARQRAEATEHELRQVAEFRERFIGILGHDLRTPLSSISMSAARLIGRGKLDEQDSVAVGRILRSSQKINRMIMQLLDLTRARLGGGMPIDRAPADLGDVVEHAIEEFEAGVQLKVDGDVSGCWDADRLSEVLTNLVGNALHHATPNTLVNVKVYSVDVDVVVEVVNRGPAIPDDVLPHIFEPFRQAQPNAKTPAGNLGLGLYIAHEIVRAHEGTLEAWSTQGTTTFLMRLPRQPAA